ncbi:hypothetical protein [Nocardia cyriacigeorgica]|uniref:hypothetical protein n=1 Tax=Nocardia cyriacigeorgica TaxID=135487 RepID=UPI001893C949|nr:hypothetical protein [Nocardia cyriacigeorgica]MBF6416925.1 hypothetical protein [Nocardia cyriacigeorgica]
MSTPTRIIRLTKRQPPDTTAPRPDVCPVCGVVVGNWYQHDLYHTRTDQWAERMNTALRTLINGLRTLAGLDTNTPAPEEDNPHA